MKPTNQAKEPTVKPNFLAASRSRRVLLALVPACIAASMLCSGTSYADSPAALAHWTFDTGTSADLSTTSSTASGGFTFVSAGSTEGSAVVAYNQGYVSLNANAELLADGINSSAYPGMLAVGTILVTMRVDADPGDLVTAFQWGLVSQASDSTAAWEGMSFSSLVNDSGGLFAYRSAGDQWLASGQSITTNTWFVVALTFNEGIVTQYLDGGAPVSGGTTSENTSLASFTGLALGRIFSASGGLGSNAISVADVQVYDSLLTSTQISTLSAEALASVPEPSTAALVIGGVIVFALVKRKRMAARRGSQEVAA